MLVLNINAITMNKTTSCFAVFAVMDTLIIPKAELSIVSVDCYCCFAMRWYVLEILQKYLQRRSNNVINNAGFIHCINLTSDTTVINNI